MFYKLTFASGMQIFTYITISINTIFYKMCFWFVCARLF